jgi:hypothetical protein
MLYKKPNADCGFLHSLFLDVLAEGRNGEISFGTITEYAVRSDMTRTDFEGSFRFLLLR